MPKKTLGTYPPPGLTKKTAETIRAAAVRKGDRFDYQIGEAIGLKPSGISTRFENCSFTHIELVKLGKRYEFTEDDWRALGCR